MQRTKVVRSRTFPARLENVCPPIGDATVTTTAVITWMNRVALLGSARRVNFVA